MAFENLFQVQDEIIRMGIHMDDLYIFNIHGKKDDIYTSVVAAASKESIFIKYEWYSYPDKKFPVSSRKSCNRIYRAEWSNEDTSKAKISLERYDNGNLKVLDISYEQFLKETSMILAYARANE